MIDSTSDRDLHVGTLGALCGLIYCAARQARIRVVVAVKPFADSCPENGQRQAERRITGQCPGQVDRQPGQVDRQKVMHVRAAVAADLADHLGGGVPQAAQHKRSFAYGACPLVAVA